MPVKITNVVFAYGLHKKQKHPKKMKRFIDVASIAGDDIDIGFTVQIKSNKTKSQWEGTITQAQDETVQGHPRYLAADIQVTVEARAEKEEKGTEDVSVTVTNPNNPMDTDTMPMVNTTTIP